MAPDGHLEPIDSATHGKVHAPLGTGTYELSSLPLEPPQQTTPKTYIPYTFLAVRKAQQQKEAEQKQQRRPPTPPKAPPPSLSGDCGDPDYEIIEFPTRPQAQKPSTPGVITYKCALCGTENVFARCDICNGNYCEACDDMNHKHPKRKNHVRRRILTDLATKTRPPLPPKGDNLSSPPPIPPPRRNRKNAQVGCNLA